MRGPGTLLFVALAVGSCVPGWTGEERLASLGDRADVTAVRVPLDPQDHARRRLGALTYLGGVALDSADRAFGGFSSLTVAGDRVTLLSDAGNIVRFRLDGRGRVGDAAFARLPAGPGTGWDKRDRDSEAMAVDPRSGQRWVAFERANAIWRYGGDFTRAERMVRPRAMREWRSNGGPESMARLHDGRFVVIAETARRGQGPGRDALVFAGDPTLVERPAFGFRYLPPEGFDPSDMTQLPDGRLLVLNRWWGLPLRFASALTVIDPAAMRPGAVVRGREIARLGAPLVSGNFEGVAATVEASKTIVWLATDNDVSASRPSLLLKFRLDGSSRR